MQGNKKQDRGWECSSVGEHLPSMCEALGTDKKKKRKKRKRKKNKDIKIFESQYFRNS
jgi:hypothetical protein